MRAEAKTFRTTDGEEFTFLFSIRGIAAAEDAANAPFAELIRSLETSRLGHLAALIYGGLKVHHAEITLEEAWGLIDGPDGKELGKAMADALRSAMPQRKAEDANPPKPRKRGTGSRSSASGAK